MSEDPGTGRTGDGGGNNGKGDGNSPLDALFELTNKALDRVNGDKSGGEYRDVEHSIPPPLPRGS